MKNYIEPKGYNMAMTKEYVINLTPIPWQRAGVKGKIFYDRQMHEKLAFGLYLNKEHGSAPKFVKPVHVEVTFYMPIPKTVKKRSLMIWHRSAPDIDNLQKFVLDAINGTQSIWEDDRIVSSLVAKKVYDRHPRTHIIITELE